MEPAGVDIGMVAADISGKMLATTGTELKRGDDSPLRAKDYFQMGDEPTGSAGGIDSDVVVFVPPAAPYGIGREVHVRWN
jgi:hypothetical protein